MLCHSSFPRTYYNTSIALTDVTGHYIDPGLERWDSLRWPKQRGGGGNWYDVWEINPGRECENVEEREILMEENKERLSGSDLFLCFIPVNASTADRERPLSLLLFTPWRCTDMAAYKIRSSGNLMIYNQSLKSVSEDLMGHTLKMTDVILNLHSRKTLKKEKEKERGSYRRRHIVNIYKQSCDRQTSTHHYTGCVSPLQSFGFMSADSRGECKIWTKLTKV